MNRQQKSVCSALVSSGVGFAVGMVTMWAINYGTSFTNCPNQKDQITALDMKVKDLQHRVHNLTASDQNYQRLNKEYENCLTSSQAQLSEKINEINHCQKEKNECEKKLEERSHASSLYMDHTCWTVPFVISMLLPKFED